MGNLIDNAVSPNVQALWDIVFQCGEIVIKHWQDFGFEGMHQPRPNIHDLLLYVTLLEAGVDASMDSPGCTAEEARLLINTKQRLGYIKLAGNALKKNCQADFDSTMEILRSQAPF